jgi:ABC-type multidrug transport system ATPase subunit
VQIIANNLGKRFNRDWIFKNLDLNFKSNNTYAITGPNGSGKSTLLQVLSSIMPYSEGKITYSSDEKTIIPEDDIYKSLSIAAPYQELIEEFTLSEQIDFHLNFKKFKEGISKELFIEILQLKKSAQKELRYFSSGMKQRVKLGLALYTDTPILFLDEPTTNLDAQGISWYQQGIKENLINRLVIVCSNQKHEYEFCGEVFDLKV